MPITLNNVSLEWPNGTTCFSDLNAVFSSHLTGLIGDNGSGKTSLIRVILSELEPSAGSVERPSNIAYLPQDLGLRPDTTVSDLFGVTEIIEAIKAVEGGQFDPELFETIGDRWNVTDEIRAVLSSHGLDLFPERPLSTLSGGEAVRVALAVLMADNPDFIVMDEPTNNLDLEAKAQLIQSLPNFSVPVLVVSHDRDLLETVSEIAELHDGQLRFSTGTTLLTVKHSHVSRARQCGKCETKRLSTVSRFGSVKRCEPALLGILVAEKSSPPTSASPVWRWV